MTRLRPPAALLPVPRTSGLAVPTLVAALVCGGSVFAIAVTGAVAIESSSLLLGAPAPVVAAPVQPGAYLAGDPRGEAAGTGPGVVAGTARSAADTAPGPARTPAQAATAAEVSVEVRGPGFDQPDLAGLPRGPLTAPRVVAAAAPTVIVLVPGTISAGRPATR